MTVKEGWGYSENVFTASDLFLVLSDVNLCFINKAFLKSMLQNYHLKFVVLTWNRL